MAYSSNLFHVRSFWQTGESDTPCDLVSTSETLARQLLTHVLSPHNVLCGLLHDESLSREGVYSRPGTGCKSGVRARIWTASHKPRTMLRSAVNCWSYNVLLMFLWVQPSPFPVQVQSKSNPSPIQVQSQSSPSPVPSLVQSKFNPNPVPIQSNSSPKFSPVQVQSKSSPNPVQVQSKSSPKSKFSPNPVPIQSKSAPSPAISEIHPPSLNPSV